MVVYDQDTSELHGCFLHVRRIKLYIEPIEVYRHLFRELDLLLAPARDLHSSVVTKRRECIAFQLYEFLVSAL